MQVNWFAITIIAIWFCAAIGSALTKNAKPFEAAVTATIIMGIGYFIMHSH